MQGETDGAQPKLYRAGREGSTESELLEKNTDSDWTWSETAL